MWTYSTRAALRAFTLIELLVVVAIIAVLMSILLPSLSAAQEAARAVVCGQKLRDLGNGLQTYFSEESDWIPGMNTSGVRTYLYVDPGDLHNAKTPVQPHDWITPILSANMEMKAIRAQRFSEIINEFTCPSQRFYNAILWPDAQAATPDWADFVAQGSWRPLSYLMPVHFQYWGEQQKDQFLAASHLNSSYTVKAKAAPSNWEVRVKDFKSKVTLVGTPSQKVAAADGTRYLDDQLLDFDPSPLPTYFGSFTSSGAWWAGSTTYGVAPGTSNWGNRTVQGAISDGKGQQLELSYRHGGKRGTTGGSARDNKAGINAMYFDGSVRKLNDRQSRNPVLWYPKGGIVQSMAEGMIDVLADGDKIP